METITEKEYLDSPRDTKNLIINKTGSKLRELIVDYVGAEINPENNEVTVENIVSVFAEEFPELLLVVAQENFLKGYEAALHESELTKKA